MTTFRRQTLRALLGVTLMTGLVTGNASAQEAAYPSKPVRIIVPYAPGGASDALARTVGQKLSEVWGQPVIVENKAGAGGHIGAELAAKSQPDGYTLLLAAAGFMAVSPSMYKTLPYDTLRDFQPLSLLVKAPLLMVVNASVPAKTLGEFIELAKSKPGKLTIGNGGTGTAQHLGSEYFTNTAGIEVVHVPYKGSAPATVDLLAGVVDAQLDNFVTLIPHLKSGKLRPLAVSSLQRVPILKDVPTMSESGLKNFETGTWYGIVGPAGMPAAIIERINRELVKILDQPDIQTKLIEQGLQPAPTTPTEYAALIRSDMARYAEIIKSAGIQPQ